IPLFETFESCFDLDASGICRVKEALIPIRAGDASPEWTNDHQHHVTAVRFSIQKGSVVHPCGNVNKVAKDALFAELFLQPVSDTSYISAAVFPPIRYKNFHI